MPRYKDDPNDPRPKHNLASAILQSFQLRGNKAEEIDAWNQRQHYNNQARLQREHLASVKALAEESYKRERDTAKENLRTQQDVVEGEQTKAGAALRQFQKYVELGLDYNNLPPSFLKSVSDQLGGPKALRSYAAEYMGMSAELQARQSLATATAKDVEADIPAAARSRNTMRGYTEKAAANAAKDRIKLNNAIYDMDSGIAVEGPEDDKWGQREIEKKKEMTVDGKTIQLPSEYVREPYNLGGGHGIRINSPEGTRSIGTMGEDGSFKARDSKEPPRTSSGGKPVDFRFYEIPGSQAPQSSMAELPIKTSPLKEGGTSPSSYYPRDYSKEYGNFPAAISLPTSNRNAYRGPLTAFGTKPITASLAETFDSIIKLPSSIETRGAAPFKNTPSQHQMYLDRQKKSLPPAPPSGSLPTVRPMELYSPGMPRSGAPLPQGLKINSEGMIPPSYFDLSPRTPSSSWTPSNNYPVLDSSKISDITLPGDTTTYPTQSVDQAQSEFQPQKPYGQRSLEVPRMTPTTQDYPLAAVSKPLSSVMNFGPVKSATSYYDSIVNALSEQADKITQPLDSITKGLGLGAAGGSELEALGAMAEAAGLTDVASGIADAAGAMSAAGPLGAIAGEVISAAETGGLSDKNKSSGMSAFEQAPVNKQPQQRSLAELARDLEKGTNKQSQRILTMPDLYQQLMDQLNQNPSQKFQRYY